MSYNLSLSSGEFTGNIPVKAGAVIEAGGLFAVDATGNAIPITSVAGSTVVGRAENDADNTDGVDGAVSVLGRRGAMHLTNSGVTPLTAADFGQQVYAESPDTVRGDQDVAEATAGTFLGFDAEGLCIVLL